RAGWWSGRGAPRSSGRAATPRTRTGRSLDQHGVVVRVEAEAVAGRPVVGGQDPVAPGEGADQDDERGARQMKIREQRVHGAETMPRSDVGAAPSFARLDASP